MAALLAVIVSLYRYEERMNQYLLLSLYAFHMYLAMELILASLAAAARALLGLDLEPSTGRTSPRRWGTSGGGGGTSPCPPCSARACTAPCARASAARPRGVLATFLVSGLVHELIILST
jgi:hypothetical protein